MCLHGGEIDSEMCALTHCPDVTTGLVVMPGQLGRRWGGMRVLDSHVSWNDDGTAFRPTLAMFEWSDRGSNVIEHCMQTSATKICAFNSLYSG